MAISRHMSEMARALVDAAAKDGVLERVVRDACTVADALTAHLDVLIDLDERAAPVRERQDAIRDVLKAQKIHEYVINVLAMLIEQHAVRRLPAFVDAVIKEAARAGHHVANVTSATALSADDRKTIETMLSEKLDGSIALREHIDPSLIGGVVIDVDEKRLDASVRGTLENLKHHLYV